MPTTPGVLSALGGLIADLKSDFIKTLYADLDAATAGVIRREFEVLKGRAVEWLIRSNRWLGVLPTPPSPASSWGAASVRGCGR